VNSRTIMNASLVAILGVAVVGSTIVVAQRSTDYTFFDPIIEVQQKILQRYQDEVDLKKLQEGAIAGMMEALNDPYSVYVPPSEATEFTKQLTGEYVGIGAQVQLQDRWLTIVSPLEDSPAFEVGLQAEDRVIKIEGTTTQGLSIDKCIEMLMGDPGTKVNIVVDRKGTEIPFEITRKRIKTRSIKGFHREDADGNKWMFELDPARKIAYIRLIQFTPRVSGELEAALRSVGADKGELKGLILDMRYNPGGVLTEAINIADLFLKEGVIVSTKGRSHPEEIARARDRGTLPDFPIAVLQNANSASASEVLAGALVENNRAIIVGTRSFGKGSVQSVHTLDRGKGAELKLTEQGYYLPSGRSITKKDDSATWGVDPTDGFYVPMTDEELTALFEVRRKLEVLKKNGDAQPAVPDAAPEVAINWNDTDSVLSALKDKQLTAAVRAVQKKIDTGTWEPTGEKLPDLSSVKVTELKQANEARRYLERQLIKLDKRITDLETAKAEPADAPIRDLWSDAVSVNGGRLKVFDKDGKEVAELEITSENLERWLIDADVKKVGEPVAAAPAATETKPADPSATPPVPK
jgi:carboxyl-terminal processing protease